MCWSVSVSVGGNPQSRSAWATGASLIASGLVPTTSLMSAKRSLPPSSAGGFCLRYGVNSTKIVGVGLELQTHRRRGDDVVLKAVPVAISDRRLFGREGHAHLRVGVARSVPARERIGAQRLLPFEFEQPAPGIRLARLGRLAFQLCNSVDGH